MDNQKLLSGSSSICGDLPESSRTRARRARNFSKFPGWTRILCKLRLLDCDCLLGATQQARLPFNQGTALCGTFPVFRTVWMNGIWRCITTGTLTIPSRNAPGERTGPHWLFLPRPVVWGHEQSASSALTNALLWEQSHSINNLVHDLWKGLIRHLHRDKHVEGLS